MTHGYDTQPVCHQLQSNLRIALVLIRLGAYAIGISEGEKLITSKVGTGLIHSRHRQGGSSERRFARHRDKQIEAFFIRVCNHARQQLEPQAKTLDYIVYGGARTTISHFQKRCPFLHQFDRRQLKLLLTIPEPRQAILKTTLSHLWTTQVTQWDDSEAITDPIAPKV
ncbi:MAG: hypothetical protein J7K77_04805 [Dehalococcoidales bacterium]|nr:hypothetical protein [Dehalococcoidales bacterium]